MWVLVQGLTLIVVWANYLPFLSLKCLTYKKKAGTPNPHGCGQDTGNTRLVGIP